jgi:ABC transporter transmembrane region
MSEVEQKRESRKNICILKLLYHWDTYRIEIQKDTKMIIKIFLSRDIKYKFISLFIYIISNRKIHIVNNKILTSCSNCPFLTLCQVISHVRTVYSNVGESKAIEAYSRSLKRALKLGKKSGLVKGLGVGSTYGLLFCVWALLLWYSGVLVTHRVTNGGKAFSTILNVIFSGL